MNDFLQRRHPLSLHHLTVLDAPVEELIAIAGQLGCDHVCLFTHVPEAARHIYPMVTADDVTSVRHALDAAGITLCNLEVFPLDEDPAWQDFEHALAVGKALGASRATVHIHQPHARAAGHSFARFCDLAADFGIIAGLEFNAFSAIKNLPEACAFVRDAGRPNAAIVCDMLHLFRSGGTPADIADAGELIGYAQLCDGPRDIAPDMRWHEAIRERMVPGEGVFPLSAAIEALPADIVLDVEVPQTAARKAGVSARERARRAVAATRALLVSAQEQLA